MNLFLYAEANPIRFTDPKGLTTWSCKRPLGKKPGEWTPWVFNHQYNCVTTADGSIQCNSTNAPPGWPAHMKPGIPSKPEDDYYNKDACNEVDDNKDDCIEKCLMNKWKQPRPPYDIGPGTDCQEYSDDILDSCVKQCSKK